MAKKKQGTAIVVGAGIVGVSTAYALQTAGFQVTLVDRVGPCAGTSYGNAGAIVDGCTPNAMPGFWKSVPSMLLDPAGPLSIRWSYLPKILPWMIRFMQESRPERVEHNAGALKNLTGAAVADWGRLMKSAGLQHMIEDVGWLKVYETDEGFQATESVRELMTRHDSKYQVLTADDIRDLEPHLNPIFKHGIFHNKSRFLPNPEKVVHGIADAFKHLGGEIVIADISSIREEEDGIAAIGSSGTIKADKLVLCTGAWSKNLAGQFGANVPLDTERGYHLMLPVMAEKGLSRPVLHGEKSFVLTPMERGVRLTSQVEFAGLEMGPDFTRIRKMLPLAKKMLPALNTEEQDAWLGYRPSLPDSIPVIGPSPNNPNVIFAFGHQHFGMTLGPTTARLVRDIMIGKEPTIPLWPYRANRFG